MRAAKARALAATHSLRSRAAGSVGDLCARNRAARLRARGGKLKFCTRVIFKIRDDLDPPADPAIVALFLRENKLENLYKAIDKVGSVKSIDCATLVKTYS